MVRSAFMALLAVLVWGGMPGLGGVAAASEHLDCDNVIDRSTRAANADEALEILGACLASRAPLPVLQRVALQMAVVSFQKGDPEWGMRYLEILKEMLEDEPEPVATSQ